MELSEQPPSPIHQPLPGSSSLVDRRIFLRVRGHGSECPSPTKLLAFASHPSGRSWRPPSGRTRRGFRAFYVFSSTCRFSSPFGGVCSGSRT